MIVQIYETQNAAEARQLASIGVDHIGVLVGWGEYPREFSPEQAKEILRPVTAPAKRVVLSLSRHLEEITEIVNKTDPDILHLGSVPEVLAPSDVQAMKRTFPGLKVMRTIPVFGEESVELAKQYKGAADFLLLDTQRIGEPIIGATGETHDWSVSKKIVESAGIPVILAGGLGPDNVAEAVRQVHPYGVDSKTKTDRAGSHEKDVDKVRRFVELARSALA